MMKTLLTSLFALTAILSTGCAEEAIDLDDPDFREAEMDILLNGEEGCGEYEVGDYWEPDGCNVCACTSNGVACTVIECNETIDEHSELVDPVLQSHHDGKFEKHADVGGTLSTVRPHDLSAPACGDHGFGEMWMEDCNLCLCGAQGIECTRKDCSENIPH